MPTYQDEWVRGVVRRRGVRDSAGRYAAIRDALGDLPKGFRVLDLGAYNGYFSFRLAAEFDARCLAVEANCERLKRLSAENGDPRVDILCRTLTPEDIRELGTFDVVLALSVLHHFEDYDAAFEAVRAASSRWLFVEIPHRDEDLPTARAARHLADLAEVVETSGPELLTVTPGVFGTHDRPLYRIAGGRRLPRRAGVVFSGSGSASKSLPIDARTVAKALGYEPYPGSLNVRLEESLGLPEPSIDVQGARDWQFWPARINGEPCHIMRPGRRGWPGHTAEIVAPQRLRDVLGLRDGDVVRVECGPPLDLGIVTTVFGDYGRWLPEWVASVAALDPKPSQVVVLVAGDAWAEARATWAASSGLLDEAGIPARLLRAPGNAATMGVLRNAAVEACETDWIIHLDADDLILPTALADVGLLAHDHDVVALSYLRRESGRDRLVSFAQSSAKRILGGTYGAASAAAFRREWWARRPFLATDYCETAFWIGLAHLGARIAGTTLPGFIYRIRPDSHHRQMTDGERADARALVERLRREWSP